MVQVYSDAQAEMCKKRLHALCCSAHQNNLTTCTESGECLLMNCDGMASAAGAVVWHKETWAPPSLSPCQSYPCSTLKMIGTWRGSKHRSAILHVCTASESCHDLLEANVMFDTS